MKEMNLKYLLDNKNLNNTLLFGWYGGGNFGDELLLSVLATLLNKSNFKNIYYIYLNTKFYRWLDQQFKFTTPIFSKRKLLKVLFKVDNIIIGGGGHWGLDMNKNVLLMSLMLLFSKFFLRKNIYLLGIGYYNSTNWLGHLSAHIAAMSADIILARDRESYENFKKYNKKNTYLDKDIAFSLSEILPSIEYIEIPKLMEVFKNISKSKKVLIVIRLMRNNKSLKYIKAIKNLIQENKQRDFILMILEPKETNLSTFETIVDIAKSNENTSSIDFSFSLLGFVKFLQLHANNIDLIAPQYHAQLVAHLVGIKHFPVIYDNKVRELLSGFNIEAGINIEDVRTEDLQKFIDN